MLDPMRLLGIFERIIIWALMIIMCLVVVVTLIQVSYMIMKDMLNPATPLINLDELLDILGSLFMVLIGLELLETIKVYLQEKSLHLESILFVAMIALARKVIILDYDTSPAPVVLGVASLIIALAVARFLNHKSKEETPKLVG